MKRPRYPLTSKNSPPILLPIEADSTGMYLIGYIVLIGGVLAALWKMGVLASIGMAWTVIGVVILIGLGIMIAVSHSGTKENIEIDRK